MSDQKKKLVPLFGAFFVFLFLLTVGPVRGEELLPVFQTITYDTYSEQLKLDEDYNSILDTVDTVRCTKTEDEICIESEEAIHYIYISNNPIYDEPNEINEKRTKNVRFYDNNTARVYGGNPFINVSGNWYYVENETISKQVFLDKVDSENTKISAIIKRNNPLGIYSASAQTAYYAGFGDGSIYYTGDGWANVHDQLTGTTAAYNAVSELDGWYENGANDQLYRIFLPFDTSDLDDDICIASSSLSIEQTSSFSGSPSFALVESTQNSPNSLITSDYDNWNTTYLSENLNAVAGVRNNVKLNEAGRNFISTTSWTMFAFLLVDDIEDITLTAHKYARWYLSDQTGTANDPYLLIETESCETGSEEETSTTTISVPCDLAYNNELSMIVGCSEEYGTSTTTPDKTVYYYYHIPFFVYLVILIPFLWIATRFILELIIRFRN